MKKSPIFGFAISVLGLVPAAYGEYRRIILGQFDFIYWLCAIGGMAFMVTFLTIGFTALQKPEKLENRLFVSLIIAAACAFAISGIMSAIQ